MDAGWELRAFGVLMGFAAAGIAGAWIVDFLQAYWADRRKWRAVPRHLGSTYDASVKMTPRPNVRLIRP